MFRCSIAHSWFSYFLRNNSYLSSLLCPCRICCPFLVCFSVDVKYVCIFSQHSCACIFSVCDDDGFKYYHGTWMLCICRACYKFYYIFPCLWTRILVFISLKFVCYVNSLVLIRPLLYVYFYLCSLSFVVYPPYDPLLNQSALMNASLYFSALDFHSFLLVVYVLYI